VASGLAEKRKGKGNSGIKDRAVSDTAGIKPYKLNQAYRYAYEDFKMASPLCVADLGGGAATGTQDDVNLLITPKNIWEYAIIGTQTIVAPIQNAAGLDIKFDDANNDGVEFTLGNHANAPLVFTAGTDAFYAKLKYQITHQSGAAEFRFGFRKVQTYTHVLNTYTDFACIGHARTNASATTDIKTVTDNDDAGETTTDSTLDYTEATDVTLGVYVNKGGWVTYTVDGRLVTAAPAFQFDAGDSIIPFIFLITHTDTANAVILKEFECGLAEANVR
jgi:hypothetical protein